MSRTLFDRNCSNIYLDLSPEAKEIKVKINKWDQVKLKTFAQLRKLLTIWKDNPQNGKKKILASYVIDKGLISKIHKRLIQLNTKKTKQPNQNMGRRPNSHFFKEDIQRTKRYKIANY